MLHFPVDLIVSEAILGGCRQKPVYLLNCNMSIFSNFPISTFWANCLHKNFMCVLHFTVDLIVTEVILGGCRQRLVDLLNCNLSILSNSSSQIFNMCGSFSCWSAIVQGKRRGMSQKSVDFVELQFVSFEKFVFKKMSYVCFIFLLIW